MYCTEESIGLVLGDLAHRSVDWTEFLEMMDIRGNLPGASSIFGDVEFWEETPDFFHIRLQYDGSTATPLCHRFYRGNAPFSYGNGGPVRLHDPARVERLCRGHAPGVLALCMSKTGKLSVSPYQSGFTAVPVGILCRVTATVVGPHIVALQNVARECGLPTKIRLLTVGQIGGFPDIRKSADLGFPFARVNTDGEYLYHIVNIPDYYTDPAERP